MAVCQRTMKASALSLARPAEGALPADSLSVARCLYMRYSPFCTNDSLLAVCGYCFEGKIAPLGSNSFRKRVGESKEPFAISKHSGFCFWFLKRQKKKNWSRLRNDDMQSGRMDRDKEECLSCA